MKTYRSPRAGGENPYLVYCRGRNQSAILRLAGTVEPSPVEQLPIIASCGSALRLTSLKEFNDSDQSTLQHVFARSPELTEGDGIEEQGDQAGAD